MPPVKKPANAATASKELAGGRKAIAWRDVEFDLPAMLPADIAWTMADIEASNGDTIGPLLTFVNQILGDDQVLKLRTKLREDNIPMDELGDVIGELLKAVFEAYGMAEGESPASE